MRARDLPGLLLHVVAPTLVGGLLYVGFREQGLLGWQWAGALGLADLGEELRAALAPLGPALGDVVIFSVPDALWVYSLTFVVARLWTGAGRERRVWLLVPLAMGVGAELGQLVGLVPGTFDPVDLIGCGAASALALWLERRTAPAAALSEASA